MSKRSAVVVTYGKDINNIWWIEKDDYDFVVYIHQNVSKFVMDLIKSNKKVLVFSHYEPEMPIYNHVIYDIIN